MRRSMLVFGTMALVLAAPHVSAQEKPSFAGTWTLVPDPNAANAGRGGGRGGGMMGGGLGQGATISQDGSTLTITRTTQMGETKSVYKLDGSDSRNTLDMRGTAVQQVSKATWDGAMLKIATSMDFNGNSIQTTMTLSLDASGQLIVESTSPGRGGGAATTTRTTYKKG